MEKTLSDEEIENDISKILTILNEKLNISLR
jgi:phenylalanyl-tRNA synthetase beta subunit